MTRDGDGVLAGLVSFSSTEGAVVEKFDQSPRYPLEYMKRGAGGLMSDTAVQGDGWFKKSILRVRNDEGDSVGLAFLVTDTVAFTCAHVANSALRTSRDEDVTGRFIELEPAFRSGERPVVEAEVEHWSPVAAPRHASDDIAVLRLRRPIDGTAAVRQANVPSLRGDLPVRVYGLPPGRSEGVWHAGSLRGVVASGWLQINQATDVGYRVEHGFSGGPVWDTARQAVIGMITMADLGEVRAAYAIPSPTLLAAVPALHSELRQPAPYPGLAPYPETMRAAFLGRDAEIRDIVERLDDQGWITITGPSGSGKSSLALAGVVPRLRADERDVIVTRPGDDLTPVLDSLANGGIRDRTVVVVDQLEEFFELPDEAQESFVLALFGDDKPARTRVVSTLRHDFLGHVTAHPVLRRATSGSRLYPLGPLHGERLRAVVTRSGTSAPTPRYEDGLVDRIVADAQASAAPMPLLSHILLAIWDESPGGRMTHRAYDEAGGIGGALDQAARRWLDEVPVGLAEKHLPHLLAKLVQVSSHTTEPTRRSVAAAELSEQERQLAQRLTTAGLLVSGGALDSDSSTEQAGGDDVRVELAHDSLFTAWGSLREFIEENRSFLVWSENLRYDARRWAEAGRDRAELLPSDTELDVAARWEHQRRDGLTTLQREYLAAGLARRKARDQRRRRGRVGIAIVATVLLVLGTILVASRSTATRQQRLAASRVLAESAVETETVDPARGILAGIAAWRTAPTDEARDRMLAQYVEYQGFARILPSGLGSARTMAHSSDGDVVVVVSELGRMTVHINVLSGQLRSANITSESRVSVVDVSEDGRRVVAFRENGTAFWFDIRPDDPDLHGPVHDLQDAQDRVATPDYAESESDWPYQAQGTMFSPNGRHVVTRVWDTYLRWDVQTGRIIEDVPAPDGAYTQLWPGDSDASTVITRVRTDSATAPEDIVTLDLRTGKQRITARDGEAWLLSGDATTLIRCRESTSGVEFSRFRVTDGVELGSPFKYALSTCLMDATNRSGNLLVSSTDTGLVDGQSVIDFEKRAVVARYPVPDSSWTTSVGGDVLAEQGGRYYQLGNAEDVSNGYIEVATSDKDADQFADQVLLGDGTRTVGIADHSEFLGDSFDYSLQLRSDEFPGRIIAEANFREPGRALGERDGIRVDPRGESVATRGGSNVVAVLDARTLREKATIKAARPPSSAERAPVRDLTGNPGLTAAYDYDDFAYFFDAAGHLVTVSDEIVQYWEIRTGHEIARFDMSRSRPSGSEESPSGITPTSSPGSIAVTYPEAKKTLTVDIVRGAVVAESPTDPLTTSVQFDPSGKYLVSHRDDHTIEVRNATSSERVLGPFQVGENADYDADEYVVRFIPDDRLLVAADNEVQIYDLGSRTQLDSFRFGGASSDLLTKFPMLMLDVSSRGERVIYQPDSAAGPPSVVPLDPQRWLRKLCAVVGHRAPAAGELPRLARASRDIPTTCGKGGS